VEHHHLTTVLNRNPHNDLYFLGTMCFEVGCTLGKEAKNSNLVLMGSEQGQKPVEEWEMVEGWEAVWLVEWDQKVGS